MPSPGYSRVTILPSPATNQRSLTEPKLPLEGHLYDISVTGVRFDLDDPLEEGESIAMEIHLPGIPGAIKTRGKIIRVYDEDGDQGPKRMAATLGGFDSPEDARRLASVLGSGFFRREL